MGRYRLEGKPGAWSILRQDIEGLEGSYHIVATYKNRGHALAALKGLQNPRVRKVRYTFRKVYRYLQARGWRIELNDPPDVYWAKGDERVKENRAYGPRALLLSIAAPELDLLPPYDSNGEKEIVKSYSEWLDSQHPNK